MGLRKLSNGQSFSLGSVSRASVVLAWDGPLDCDVAFGLGANNMSQELVYFDNPYSQAGNGAVRVSKDKRNGFGLGKSDESGEINLSALPPHVTEVAVGALVQNATFGQVQNAEVMIYDAATRHELARTDLDATFYPFPGGKVGEFQRQPNGTWQFVMQHRGFADLGLMEQALMQ